MFRSPTNLGYLIPRVFMDDTEEDRKAILPLVNQIMAYPLSHYTGQMQTKDWTRVPSFPAAQQSGGEIKWVVPEMFFDALSAVLNEVPPLPGEQSLYAWVRSVLDAAAQDPALKTTLQQAAREAEQELVEPLLQFRNVGVPVKNGWTTPLNGAAFGTDYLTRTAVARSNIFVNKHQETAYFYQEYAAEGGRLSGQHIYTVTFTREGLPPAQGFWSLTLYDEHHFFVPNEQNRYSLGTKNKHLKYNQDGSLTLYVQATPPEADKHTDWLPAPQGEFALYIRIYWPEAAVIDRHWAPPPVLQH